MATANQIAAERNREEARANRAQEAELHRSNKEKEDIAKKEHTRKWVETGANFVTGLGKVLTSRKNDKTWYTQVPGLIPSGSYFPFSQPAGAPFRIGDVTLTDKGGYTPTVEVPNALALYLVPTLPTAMDQGQNITDTAMYSLYSYVRHANSGSKNYEAVDYLMYIAAMAEIYAWVGSLDRLYATMQTYDALNRVWAEKMVKLEGFDFQSFIGRIAELRYYINMIKYKIAQWYTPAGLPYFDRKYWLYSNIFKDGESAKSNHYLYAPMGTWIIDATSAYTQLTFKDLHPNGDLISYEKMQEITDLMLSGVEGIEDIGIMSGDTLKAFGGNVHKLDITPETVKMVPAYAPEVLDQFHNATIIPWSKINKDTLSVTQNEGRFVCEPRVVCGYGNSGQRDQSGYYGAPALIDFVDKAQPSNEDLAVATRLTCAVDLSRQRYADPGNQVYEYYLTITGTEIPVGALVNPYWDAMITGYTTGVGTATLQWSDVMAVAEAGQMASSFTYSPRVVVISSADINPDSLEENKTLRQAFFWNFNNFATMGTEVLATMHAACTYSLLSTPETIRASKTK